jgi:hypothetical protein
VSAVERLHVAPRPCNTCPYLRSTPPGIWHPDEYAKLPHFDDDAPLDEHALATFHCHQQHATGVPTVCRGWLGVHRDSIAVRVAQIDGRIDPADVPTEPDPTMYDSGAEACAVGLAAVDAPPPEAFAAQVKLLVSKVVR